MFTRFLAASTVGISGVVDGAGRKKKTLQAEGGAGIAAPKIRK